MTLHRREFLKTVAALSAAAALPRSASAQGTFAPRPGAWRAFQIVTRLEIVKPEGKIQAWIPLPAVNEAEWSRPISNEWRTSGKAALVHEQKYGAEMLHVEFANGDAAPVVEVTSKVATRDRAIDLTKPGPARPLSDADRKLYTAPTALIPTDGIVAETSNKIVAGVSTEIEKAQAIYEWIVDNTFRDAKVRGCGIGDIAAMLESGNLGGKCADLNALFVGLARAAKLPARDLYGIRVVPSQFGYKSLGAGSENVTKAQHCRAEVYLSGFGWVPVDPADVRKVALEEPPANLPLYDPKVTAARRTLFGAWEGNWLAYNVAHDLWLPGAKGQTLNFLMYPQAETSAGLLDCLDPDAFEYRILAKELTAA
jgi:transglutaminase-like putative cysteine protease